MAGVNAPTNDTGEGGDGVNTYDTWLQAVESSQALGEEISSVRWLAGGGGGAGHVNATTADGGKGGGGNGSAVNNSSNGQDGTALTGGGGGGGSLHAGWGGKAGGSGFVMFRYAGGSALNLSLIHISEPTRPY